MVKTKSPITYTRLEKGNVIILVPNERRDKEFGFMENRILWSLKEFEGKVFSEMDAQFVLKTILQLRLTRQQPIYNITISLYDDEWIDDEFVAILKNFWEYYAMKQTYRYYDKIIADYIGDIPLIGLISHVGWDNNTRDVLGVRPLDSTIDFDKGIMFSSYTNYSEEFFEELIIKWIAKCEKLPGEYQYAAPIKKEKEYILPEPITVEDGNSFFLFREDKVYCGLKSVDADIICESSWRHYTAETYRYGKKDQKFICTIRFQKNGLDIFKDAKISNDPNAIQKVLYSAYLQIITIIKANQTALQQQFQSLAKIIFTVTYIKQKQHTVISFLDKDWNLIGKKEIPIEDDIEDMILNKEEIVTLLIGAL